MKTNSLVGFSQLGDPEADKISEKLTTGTTSCGHCSQMMCDVPILASLGIKNWKCFPSDAMLHPGFSFRRMTRGEGHILPMDKIVDSMQLIE